MRRRFFVHPALWKSVKQGVYRRRLFRRSVFTSSVAVNEARSELVRLFSARVRDALYRFLEAVATATDHASR